MKSKKKRKSCRRFLSGVFLCSILCGPIFAPSVTAAENTHAIGIQTDFGAFILPFQIVNGTELYSFKEGKGFPAAETTIWTKGRYQFVFGAASVLGTDVNVPFIGIQHRLNPKIFDTSNNELQFGVWVGRPSRRLNDEKPRTLWGIKCSVVLW